MVDLGPVSDQQKQLALSALQEFDSKQFTSCCNIMNKLMAQRGNDPRVVHNKAVADFCLSGLQSTDEFRHSLANVCSMVMKNNCCNLYQVSYLALCCILACLFLQRKS